MSTPTRLLRAGEIIQPGDLWEDLKGACPASDTIGQRVHAASVGYYFRPIPQPELIIHEVRHQHDTITETFRVIAQAGMESSSPCQSSPRQSRHTYCLGWSSWFGWQRFRKTKGIRMPLILKRRPGESITINDDIHVHVVRVTKHGNVILGVSAPKSVAVLRSELSKHVNAGLPHDEESDSHEAQGKTL